MMDSAHDTITRIWSGSISFVVTCSQRKQLRRPWFVYDVCYIVIITSAVCILSDMKSTLYVLIP
jgi:hypothetical protein